MDRLEGVLERITYVNEENGYSVFKIKAKGYANLITLTGKFPVIAVGTVLKVEGEWTNHPTFGKQFSAAEWEESLLADIHGIEKYLGSGLIKGVGPKFAKLIVNKFGTETIQVIENEPDRLLEIPKIGNQRIQQIIKSWNEQKEIHSLMLFLGEHGVSSVYGHKIYKEYRDKSIEILKNNPYQMIDDIYGIGFVTADTIAQKIGISHDSYARTRAGIFYVLGKMASEGHCFVSHEELVRQSAEILQAEETIIIMTMDHLISENELIRDTPERIYLPPFYYAETNVAHRLKASMGNVESKPLLQREEIEKGLGFALHDSQWDAANYLLSYKLGILTGGPGTGKTTLIKAIVVLSKNQNKKVLLAAPTGRAAKRLGEATDMPAKTIHALLESTPPNNFAKNEEHPLKGEVLIVDEASMIDILLMNNLLKAIPCSMQVFFVGDADQLPPVGAGKPFEDMILSKKIPCVRLTEIFRQSQKSQIIITAHKINAGEMPPINIKKKEDFFFIKELEPEKIKSIILDLCKTRLPKKYGLDPIKDIQVITPMKKGIIGTDSINSTLQEALNPTTSYLERAGIRYKVGDKVMQVKNNYDKNIFNGNLGFINSVNLSENRLTVSYDTGEVVYDLVELEELIPAYAITVHKSQGGEFPIVIMPVSKIHSRMLSRKLLYTGVTRAKNLLILIGDMSSLKIAINNTSDTKRGTWLSEKLCDIL